MNVFIICVQLYFIPVIWVDSSTYGIDLNETSRRFDGIGALSAGGTTRLLIDYPPNIRNQTLDYLFKPNFGACLQIIKVEIGGDTWAGCGTESSHMHNSTDLNYNRGYEWWLINEAKIRNPDIKVYGLPWGFPSWIGSGALNENMANYIINWILGAKLRYNVTIDYIGIWNEDHWSIEYVVLLYNKLKENKLENITKIVVADGMINNVYSILDGMENNKTFDEALDIIGIHYPPSSESTYNMSESGKILWSSEDSSTNDDIIGAGCWARILNWNYIFGNYTGTIMWPILSSWYQYLPYYADGLMNAAWPWTNEGYYQVRSVLYVTAHWTQFINMFDTGVDWYYIKQGKGSGVLENGGSYVTLRSISGNNNSNSNGFNFTIVIETMEYEQSLCIRDNPTNGWTVKTQNVTFNISNIFINNTNINYNVPKSLYYWKTVLLNDTNADNPLAENSTVFIEQKPVDINYNSNDGCYYVYLYNIKPNSVITLTTINSGHKGSYSKPITPKTLQFALPYFDNFNSYFSNKNRSQFKQIAKYFSDQTGIFSIELKRNSNDHTNYALEQVILNSPSMNNTGWQIWRNGDAIQPLTIIGTYDLINYTVSAEALMIDANHTKNINHNSSNKCENCSTIGGINGLESNIVIGLRLGGPLTEDGCMGQPREYPCVTAFGQNWYDYGYFLHVVSNGFWELLIGGRNNSVVNGSIDASLVNNVWFNVSFGIDIKDRLSAIVDGKVLFKSIKVNDSNINKTNDLMTSGWAGIGCGWQTCQFDNFKLY